MIAEEDQNIKITLSPKLRHLELKRLPKMHKFCHHMDKLEFSSLKELIIRDCPMMETFCTPFSVSSLSKLEQVTPSFFNNEVLFPYLSKLKLSNIKEASIFGETIPINSFCSLQQLEMSNCDKMTNVFSDPNIFTSLVKLVLKNCGELREVIAEEHQNIILTLLFPQLSYLGLTRLPKLHKFCHIKDDLELSSLEIVDIDDCPMLETFSLGSLHLPAFRELKRLSDPNFATKIFFHKEKSSHKSHLDNYGFTKSATDLSFNTEGDVPHWFLSTDLSDHTFFSVAVLYFDDYCKSMHMIEGKLETEELLEGVVYEIILIIRHDDEFGQDKSFILHGEVPQHNNTEREINVDEIPREKWVEILVGEFIREPRHIGDLYFSIFLRSILLKSGDTFELWIKGIVIRSKGSNE